MSFSFITGFVAKIWDSSSLTPRFEGFPVPALPNASTNRKREIVIFCADGQALPWPFCSLRLRCERLLVAARRSMKELSTTTVSFWLRMMISHVYLLSGSEQPVPAPRARVSRDIAPSLLFKKNFAVNPGWDAGAGCRLATFPRRYLRDVVRQSLDSFHLGPVVAVQALVSPWPARLDIPLLINSGLAFYLCCPLVFLFPSLDTPWGLSCWWWGYVSTAKCPLYYFLVILDYISEDSRSFLSHVCVFPFLSS